MDLMNWKPKDEPIIQSLLDMDMYKFTMGQLIHKLHPTVPVTFGLINRTKTVNLAKHISKEELTEQLDHARSLRYLKSELHYLRGTNEYQERMFSEDYLDYLSSFQLPEYNLEYHRGKLQLSFSGEWTRTTYWETIALSIITELYTRSQVKSLSQIQRDCIISNGVQRLQGKIIKLKKYPEITFSDFATRRRAFRSWHEYIVDILCNELPAQFIGTSNVKIAMDQNLLPMGTNAHELYMVYSRLFGNSSESIRYSVQRVGIDWWNQYTWGLAISLTDTFGSDSFFRDFSFESALRGKGFRHDSGDPIAYGEKVIAFYKKLGIDPREKMIVFSDGLDVDMIIKIHLHFRGRIKIKFERRESRIKTTFGWGTGLGNDLGLSVLSLVVKILMANGQPTVKLSDNLSKGLGPIKEQNRFKKIFDYQTKFFEACKY